MPSRPSAHLDDVHPQAAAPLHTGLLQEENEAVRRPAGGGEEAAASNTWWATRRCSRPRLTDGIRKRVSQH